MIRIVKALWRTVLDPIIFVMLKLRALGAANHKKDVTILDVDLAVWPYDLVIDLKTKKKLAAMGDVISITHQDKYVIGTVVGYVSGDCNRVKVSYLNAYEVGKPILRTFHVNELEVIDSPVRFLNVMTTVQQSGIVDIMAQESFDTGEDPNGGETVH